MRLTLRTLLGYLDDVLAPQQAKALGEKINESGFASSLVTRIREVTRRRRLTAPEVSGPGSNPDPNVVAEYLDNTLPPDKVEDFERLCLHSDVHLAEAAACHQILTLVLGEPVEVSNELRERMYALGHASPAPDAEQDGKRPAAAKAPVATVGPAAAAAAPGASGLPEYLTPRWNWKRYLIPAAALLLVALWLGLIFSDPAQPWRPDASQPLARGPVVAGLDDGDAESPAAEEAAGPVEPVVAANEPISPIVPNATPEAIVDTSESPMPEPMPEQPAEPAAPETVAAAAGAATPAPGAAATPQAAQPAAATPQAPTTPPVAAPTRLVYTSITGVLLREDAAGDWKVLPRTSLVRPLDRVGNPEPFESMLEDRRGGFSVTLTGGSRVTPLPSAEDEPLAINVDTGRLIFRRPPIGGSDDPARFALQSYGSHYLLELLTRGAEVGLEVRPHMSAGPPEEPQQLSYDGAFYLTQGEARITSAAGEVWNVGPGMAVLEIVKGAAVSTPAPLEAPPEWMTPLTGGALAIARTTASQFESEFQLDRSVAETIPALLESRYPRIAELATQTLVLTENYRALVRALQAEHEEARLAALIGLSRWVRRDPDHGNALAEEVGRSYPDDEVEPIQQLIWGFSPEDARDPELSAQLVQWLGHRDIAIRQMAFFHILKLTGGTVTYRYRPDGSESQRNASIRQWENHLKRNGALVPPNPEQLPVEVPEETADE